MLKYDDEQFPFQAEIRGRFKRWTNISDEEIDEALVDITGDTYYEMRKLVSKMLAEIERMIQEGLYPGHRGRKPLTEDEKKNLKTVKEDFKTFSKESIEGSWSAMLNKQKIGIDKLALGIKPYLKENGGKD